MAFGDLVAVIIWLGGIHLNGFLLLIEVYWGVYLGHPYGLAAIVLHLTLSFFPTLSDNTPAWASLLAGILVRRVQNYFPVSMEVEDERVFSGDRPYLIGLEPHSVLPLGMVAFAENGSVIPKHLDKSGSRGAFATNAIFSSAFVRHLWTWLGVRSASKSSMTRYLKEGKCCILVPGGVQECLTMEHNVETLFLKKRTGFVKLALTHGAPIVPAFAFGQCNTFGWLRPGPPVVPTGFVRSFSRFIGFAPLLFGGRWGSVAPYQTPMLVVVGKPIEVPLVAEPTKEQTQLYLAKYIEAMEALFHEHKHKVPTIQALKIL
mmetsp:Transcript_34748/g.58375  ORF Transcript_34748/g.58375 Transcript_34748/m.58375 type:complete len:317 (+) Transcript_34748:332-1282(+)